MHRAGGAEHARKTSSCKTLRTLQQRTSVVKGARDPLCVISTSVTLRSAPVITGAFSLRTHQWKPSFEPGQDWTSGSLWTDTLSLQTWLPFPTPPSSISACAVKQEDRLAAHSLSWHSWHIGVSGCASPDPSFPSVLHISSKVVRRTSVILFVLWDGGRNVLGYDVVMTVTSLVDDYKPQTGRKKKKVWPWHRHLVVGCGKGR